MNVRAFNGPSVVRSEAGNLVRVCALCPFLVLVPLKGALSSAQHADIPRELFVAYIAALIFWAGAMFVVAATLHRVSNALDLRAERVRSLTVMAAGTALVVSTVLAALHGVLGGIAAGSTVPPLSAITFAAATLAFAGCAVLAGRLALLARRALA